MDRTNIVAGFGELPFDERYHLKITLPMSEAEFLALLNSMDLHYSICGDRDAGNSLPTARHPATVDLSNASKCYEVDGEVDPVRRIGKRYRAFLDDSHRVIYIENAFSYTGP